MGRTTNHRDVSADCDTCRLFRPVHERIVLPSRHGTGADRCLHRKQPSSYTTRDCLNAQSPIGNEHCCALCRGDHGSCCRHADRVRRGGKQVARNFGKSADLRGRRNQVLVQTYGIRSGWRCPPLQHRQPTRLGIVQLVDRPLVRNAKFERRRPVLRYSHPRQRWSREGRTAGVRHRGATGVVAASAAFSRHVVNAAEFCRDLGPQLELRRALGHVSLQRELRPMGLHEFHL